MKKIKTLTNCRIAGKRVAAGKTVEVEDKDAHYLCGTKKAEYVTTADKKAATEKKGVTSKSGLK